MQEADPETRETVRVEAIVTESLPNAIYRVKLEDGRCVTAHVSKELRMHLVRVLPGEKVIVHLSRFDLKRGRIVRKV